MKKLRILFATSSLVAFSLITFLPNSSNAQGNPIPDEDDWICCQSDFHQGCTTIYGTFFETDYKLYADYCP